MRNWMLLCLTSFPLLAGQVTIEDVVFTPGASRSWNVAVTLRHQDSGWQHYADRWRVVDAQGTVLGERILHHPHVEEQPFTRSLRGVTIPRHLRVVYIEAHDKQHGWSAQKVSVELDHSQRVAKRLP